MHGYRVDTGSVRGVQRTPQGGICVDGAVSKACVLFYRDAQGIEFGELIPAEELFRADSIETLKGATVTIGHPSTPVSPENYAQLNKGHVGGDVRRDGDLLVAPLVVQDAAAIEKCDAGDLHELSAGYVCDLEDAPGTFNGDPYIRIQRNRRYNHVALLPPGAGRAGSDVALRMDGAAVQVERPKPSVLRLDAAKEVVPMKLKVRGKEIEIRNDADMPAAQAAVDEVQSKADAEVAAKVAQLDAAQAALTDAMGTVAKLKADIAAASAPADGAEPDGGAEPMPDDVLDALQPVRGKLPERLVKALGPGFLARQLHADAKAVIGDSFAAGSKKPDEIRREILAKIAPGVRLDALDAKAIGSIYAASISAFLAGKGSAPAPRRRTDSLEETIRRVNEGGPPAETLDQAREDARNAEMERGRKPLGKAAAK
jgi:hypothetical protein